MATSYLIVGSKFRPFSFAEMVQPLQMYKQEFERQEELYNSYAENAGLIGSDLNPVIDAEIINNVYNPYMSAIESSAEDLAKNGLSANTRRNLLDLRRRFSKEIAPIKLASEARKAARENWDKMLASDKSLMTNANPYYLGLSSYMNGASPETSYVSGNELYQRGMNLSKAFSNTMRDVPEEEALALYGQYFRIIKQYGADSKEADEFLKGNIASIPALAEQVDDIMNSSGIYGKGFTDLDKQKAYQYIVEGMKAGLSGRTDVQYIDNKLFKPNGGAGDNLQDPRIASSVTSLGIVPVDSQRKDNKRAGKAEKYSTFEEINYNGQNVLVSPELKALYYYASHPEAKEEYLEWRQEQLDKITEGVSPRNATDALMREQVGKITQFNKDFPENVSIEHVNSLIDKELKKTKEDLDSYSYLTASPKVNAYLGTNLDVADNRVYLRAYNYDYNPTDVDKLVKNMQRSKYMIYEYDPENQRASSKALSLKESSALFNDENNIERIYRDYSGKDIVETTDGKSYYVAGDDNMQLATKMFESTIRALTYFGKDSRSVQTPTGSYSIGGVGDYSERPEINHDSLSELVVGTNAREALIEYIQDGLVVPTKAGGNIINYKMSVTDSKTGIPVNLVFSPDGTLIGKLSADEYIIGGAPSIYSLSGDMAKQMNDNAIYKVTR